MKNISAAIVKAQAQIKAAYKSGDNKFDKYVYAKLEDFYDAAKPAMASCGLALVVSVESVESLPDRTTKNGGVEHSVRCKLSALLVHESGESIGCTGYGEGQDRADKALYKAITGGKKYLLASMFSIPTTDDPEADETVGLTDKHNETPKKMASTTGEIKTKKPEYTPEQRERCGAAFAEIRKLGGKLGDDEVAALWRRMAYDNPETTIEAAETLRDVWRDIDMQSKTEGATP